MIKTHVLLSLLHILILLVVPLCMIMKDMNITVALPYGVTVELIYMVFIIPFIFICDSKLQKSYGVSLYSNMGVNINDNKISRLSVMEDGSDFKEGGGELARGVDFKKKTVSPQTREDKTSGMIDYKQNKTNRLGCKEYKSNMFIKQQRFYSTNGKDKLTEVFRDLTPFVSPVKFGNLFGIQLHKAYNQGALNRFKYYTISPVCPNNIVNNELISSIPTQPYNLEKLHDLMTSVPSYPTELYPLLNKPDISIEHITSMRSYAESTLNHPGLIPNSEASCIGLHAEGYYKILYNLTHRFNF
jgi:hypothetical protein